MNEQYALICDLDLCTGCRACELACKQEHNLPVGVNWMKVVQVGPRQVGTRLALHFVPSHCMHCARPACIEACPLGAIVKRSDGIVLIDEGSCDGCLVCIEACPLGAPVLNPETGSVQMCNLCVGRVEAGLLPACVHHCMTNCLKFGEVNGLVQGLRERAALSRVYSYPV